MVSPEISSAQILDALAARRLSADKGQAGEADPIRQVAKEFETAFLAEMLKHTGVGAVRESFGGGPGEEAFAGMLTRAYAQHVTDSGAIGLADRVYATLKSRMEA